MSDFLGVELTGFQELRAAILRYHPRLFKELKGGVRWAQLVLQRTIVQGYLSGQALRRITGRLSRSIHITPVTVEGGDVVGEVGTNVEYARIHELGGQTKAHIIRPRHARALRWVDSGGFTFSARSGKMGKSDEGWIFAKEVHHPGSKIPRSPFIRPAMEDKATAIHEHFRECQARAWSER